MRVFENIYNLSFISYVIAIGFFIGVSGCTSKSIPHEPHKMATPEILSVLENTSNNLKLKTDPALNNFLAVYEKREKLSEEIFNKETNSERLKEIINSLVPLVLNKNNIENKKIIYSEENYFQTSLYLLNNAIIAHSTHTESAEWFASVLAGYEAFLFFDCKIIKNPNDCSLLKYYVNEQTDQVLLLIAKKYETAIAETRTNKNNAYYENSEYLFSIYRIINDYLGKQPNFDFYLRYVQYSGDIYEYFKFAQKKSLPIKDSDIRIHGDRLNIALSQLRDQKDTTGKNEGQNAYCTFIQNLNPYTYDLNRSESIEKRGKERIILEYIKCAKEFKNLNSTVSNYVNEQRQAVEKDFLASKNKNEKWNKSIFDLNYYSSLEYLKQNPNLMNNLGIKAIERSDTAFFVIDQLFNEKFDQKIASEYWKTIENVNEYELFLFVENYVRVRTAYTLKKTYEIFAKTLREEYEKRGSKDGDAVGGSLSSNFFTQVSEITKENTVNEWAALKRKIRILRTFLTANYHNKYKNVFEGSPLLVAANIYNRVVIELSSIDEHFNYLVNLPMTLVMAYYTSKLRGGQIKVFYTGWDGTNSWGNIDSDKFFSNFFESNYRTLPFFTYGTSRYDYNFFQIKHGFDFALRTGLFDVIPFDLINEEKKIFQNNPDKEYSGLNNEYLFFKEYIRHRLNKNKISGIKDIDEIDRHVLKNLSFLQKLENICTNPFHYSARFNDVFSLYDRTFPDDAVLQNGLSAIYSSTGSMHLIHSEIEHIEELLKILRNFFMEKNSEKKLHPEKYSNREMILKSIESELNEYKKIIRIIARKKKEADDLVVNSNRNCLIRLHNAETIRQNTLLENSVNYYKDLHAAMTLLNLLPVNIIEEDSDLEKIKKIIFHKIESEWPQLAATGKDMQEGIVLDTQSRMKKIADIVFQENIWNDPLKSKSAEDSTIKNKMISLFNSFFWPHNTAFQSILYENQYFEWGFYIKEMENFFRSDNKPFYKPKSYFNRSELIEHKRDALLRTWRFLQSTSVSAAILSRYSITDIVDPTKMYSIGSELQLSIEPFSVLQNNNDFNSDKFNNTTYQINQKAFVINAMTNYSGKAIGGNQFFSWNTTERNLGLQYLLARSSFLENLIEYRGLDISNTETEVCSKNAWGDFKENTNPDCKVWNIPLKDYLSNYLQILSLYKLDKKQRDLLEWQNIDGKYDNNAIDYLQFKDHTDTDDWTYFDEFLRENFTTVTVMDPTTHIARKIDKIEGYAQFERFRDTRKKRVYSISHLFPLNEIVTSEERTIARKNFINQLEQVRTVEAIIENLENSKIQFSDFIFQRAGSLKTDKKLLDNRWRLMEVKLRESGDRSNTPIYLNGGPKSAKNWFKQILEDFVVTETDCEIIPQVSDPDYEEISDATKILLIKNNGDCKKAAEIWQDEFDILKKKIPLHDMELSIPNELLQ